MKRHPALQALSRDHHEALVVAQRLQRAGESDASAAQAEFLQFWRTDGEPHFRAEEEVLLPRFAVAGGADNPAVERVLREHAEIRLRALQLQSGPASTRALQALGKRLADHVRLEERELFPAIEAALDEPELSRLASDVAAAEHPGHPA
jgi:hypothetical protein